MPTSPSPRRGARAAPPAAPDRPLWPRMALIAVLAMVAVAAAALPASLLARFLPASAQADDFSGTVWHGSAGRLSLNNRDAGALEWRLHPLALFKLHIAADLHWVKGGFVLDGAVDAEHGAVSVSDVDGGGPIADLRDFGAAAGWSGTARVRIQQMSAGLLAGGIQLKSATGEIEVSDFSSPQLAPGANLGGYALRFSNPAITPDTEAVATLADTGGPVGVEADIRVSLKTRTGLFSGTVKQRPDTPPALKSQLDNIAQLHPRDAQGRIPVDLEFTF